MGHQRPFERREAIMRTGRWAHRLGLGLLLLWALGLSGAPGGALGARAAGVAARAAAPVGAEPAPASRPGASAGPGSAAVAGAPTGAAPVLAAEPVGAAAGPAAPPQLQPVRLGIVATSSEVGIHLANERGYFAEQGLAPDFSRFDSATFAVAPLSSGELDVASGAVSAALFNVINRGVELRLVAPLSR